MKIKIQYSIGGSLEPTPTEIQFDNVSLREAVREWLNNESDQDSKIWPYLKLGRVSSYKYA